MRKEHDTAKRFIDETLKLIAEKGGSTDINLRQISKRIGVAHTSAYRYFKDFNELKFAAYEVAIELYAKATVKGLCHEMNPYEYFTGLIKNFIRFFTQNPGIYRFISTDPIQVEDLPERTLQRIIEMKTYFIQVITTLSMGKVDGEECKNLADILLAYIDGEAIALISDRILPGEDIYHRVIHNSEKIFTLFTSRESQGIPLKEIQRCDIGDYPQLKFYPEWEE